MQLFVDVFWTGKSNKIKKTLIVESGEESLQEQASSHKYSDGVILESLEVIVFGLSGSLEAWISKKKYFFNSILEN